MAKLEGKLPFVGAVYSDRRTGEKIKVVSRKKNFLVDEPVGITLQCQPEQGLMFDVWASDFYEQFKRCKEGTAFHIEEGWNE